MSAAFDSNVTLLVEVTFDAPSNPTPTWVDLTLRAQSIAIKRGRSYELDDFQAGSATVKFDNRDRMLDPSYSGAYSGLLPMARLRISATYAGVSYPLFYGYISGWPVVYDQPNNATTTVTAYDALSILRSDPLENSTLANAVSFLDPYAWWSFDDEDGSTVILDRTGNGRNGEYGTQGTITYGTAAVPVGAADSDKSVTLAQSFTTANMQREDQFCQIPASVGLMESGDWTIVGSFTSAYASTTFSDGILWSRSLIKDTLRQYYVGGGGPTYGPWTWGRAAAYYRHGLIGVYLNVQGDVSQIAGTAAGTVQPDDEFVQTALSDATFDFSSTSTNRYFVAVKWEYPTITLRVVVVNSAGTVLYDNSATSNTTSNGRAVTACAPTAADAIQPSSSLWIGASKAGVQQVWLGTNPTFLSQYLQPLQGRVDEVVYWDRALTTTELNRVVEGYKADWATEYTGTRVTRVLDNIEWDANLRDVDTGSVNVVQGTLGGDALSYLKTVVRSESGNLFCDGQGRVVFRDRNALLNSATTVVAAFGDDPDATSNITYDNAAFTYDDALTRYQGSLWYEGITFLGYDDRLVSNVIEVTYNAGTVQKRDPSQYDRYRWRKRSIETLLSTFADAASMALYEVGRYSEPRVRVGSVTLNPRRQPEIAWQVALDSEIGEAVDVTRTPQIGAAFSVLSIIEGVVHDIDARSKSWKTTFTLSPADQTNYLIWDDPSRGRWDLNRWGP